jgi:hypothetical protein
MPYIVSDDEIALLVANISIVNDDIQNLNKLLSMDVIVMSLVLISLLILICIELFQHTCFKNITKYFGIKTHSHEKYGTSLLSDSDGKGPSV